MPAAKITTRLAQPDDAGELSEMYALTCRTAHQGIIPHANLDLMIAKRRAEWWQRLIAQGTKMLVLDHDGAVAGYAMLGAGRYREAGYPGEIYEIYVEPAHQGIGLGTLLLEASMQELHLLNLHGTMAWSLADAEQACRFFEARGGREFARSELIYPARTLARIAYGWRSVS